ncbi:TetR family transcriptional regulator [Paenibacillus ferrarius]|uniref:TetR family transcriptional regulator n=1 Tax=Paenibacillus ferrarius TaxID=1469647 RepID=A0A1V4HH04_9BACL|nr:TetR family transcriptional regulator [Paenibacillus ferrarius]OPH54807.1 TetR family transcriptional regulator [Paenibacillus ferrarius]
MANDQQPLTKEAILDAAEQVLRRYGPEKTSVVDVAKVLQVSHGTLYRHFPSKSALREAVTERWLLGLASSLQEIANQTEGQARDRLRLWLDTLVVFKRNYVLEDPEMFSMYRSVTQEAVKLIQDHVHQLIQQITQIVDAGVKTQEFHVDASEDAARAIFLATSRFHHPAHAPEWLDSTNAADFERVWQLVLKGIS